MLHLAPVAAPLRVADRHIRVDVLAATLRLALAGRAKQLSSAPKCVNQQGFECHGHAERGLNMIESTNRAAARIVGRRLFRNRALSARSR